MTYHIGFSGTREGMNEAQRRKVTYLIDRAISTIAVHAHHGCCVGADEEFHVIAGERQLWIVGHPPIETKWRSRVKVDDRRDPKPYQDRNMDIARECHEMVAAPRSDRPDNSGTWSTIRKARRLGKPVTVVGRDGRIIED